ncbi:MAG: phosphotransferase family protein [Rhodospirillaceae bacterium]|jgi:aminoglycoside phosphotransferase (APT) family kinase protein|nr:phosphotransferase family protein [Rhodospirillaceae bacterium]MBT5666686.1 phosphotransferase family protein [Rhodospirillaceae bacterium]MBT5808726.1 phosphotransferase family protein [Rhodospirillaceae bacterium]
MTSGPGTKETVHDPAVRTRLSAYIANAADADGCVINRTRKLEGGAIQENYALDLEISGGPNFGRLSTVLRTNAPTGVVDSHNRSAEFALTRAAYEAGVLVPVQLWCCEDATVIGKPFSIMMLSSGEARREILAQDDAVANSRAAIAEQLGRQLAKIHAITPDNHTFDFLTPPLSPALSAIAYYRAQLDQRPDAYPAIEWGLRWLERNAPEQSEIVMVHRDFRVGNFLIDDGALTAILDWEFAGWGDPHEDIGWLCARCWRFENLDRELGGIADRAPFYRAYQQSSGREINETRVHYWEVYAHVRWAMIALQQADRYLVGGEANLDAALSGHRLAELETEILRMTPPEAA